MKRLVMSFFMVLLIVMVVNGCQNLPGQLSEETPGSTDVEEPGGSSEGGSYLLTLTSSEILAGFGEYKDSFVLNNGSVVVGIQNYGEDETDLELKIFSLDDATYTKSYKVFNKSGASYNIPVYLVGGWDENHVWMIHSGPGSLTLFYQSSDKAHSINLEEECGIINFNYKNEGKTLYIWQTPKNFWVFQFLDDGIKKKHIEIAPYGEIKSVVPGKSTGDFYIGLSDASVLKYRSFEKVGEIGFENAYVKDVKLSENGYLYALVTAVEGGKNYLVKINPTTMTEVSSKLIDDGTFEANYIIPYLDRLVVLLSKPVALAGGYMEYYAVYDDEFNTIASPTTIGWMDVYPFGKSILNPGYGVDSNGNLWFFLQQRNPLYPSLNKISHVLLVMDEDGKLLALEGRFDRVDHFSLKDDKGIVIEYDEYWGNEHLKTFSLVKSE